MNAWLKAAILISTIAGIFGAGWQANGWRKDAEIALLQKGESDDAVTQAKGALTDLTTAAANINKAAGDAQVDNTNLAAQLAALRKDIKNAKPLPADCKPDADRLRSLTSAVDATNAAAARSVPGR